MRMMVWIVGISALSLMAQPVRSQHVKYEKYELPNGMTVILHEDRSLPLACVNLWYRVGSRDEVDRRTGFAHLFEHLMFMGTRRVPGNDFDVLMESAGGYNNASTSEDRTNYYSMGPSELLPTLLWLDADRLEDLGREMTREKLDKQRDVVRNERRQTGENTPYGRAEMRIPEFMFPEGHPYHHPVIGSHADLEAATVDDVKNFFATYYVPSNASLVVAGNFDPQTIKPLISRLFGTLPRGSEIVGRPSAPAKLDHVIRTTMTDAVQFAKTMMVYHSPAYSQPGDAEMQLAGAVLSDGVSSRLYQKLIYLQDLAVDVSAYQSPMHLQSLFFVEATAKPGVSLNDVEKVIDETVREFVAGGPSGEELDRQKAKIEFAKVTALQSLLRRADQLNEYQYAWGEPDSFGRDLDRYRQATPAGVQQWCQTVLTPGARLILRVIPELEAVPEARDTRPGATVVDTFAPPQPESFKLSNGVQVHHWRKSELPLFQVSLVVSGGAALDGAARAGRAALMTDMLDEGAGAYDAVQFADALNAIGARLSTECDYDGPTLGVSALSRFAGKAVDLLGEAALHPRFDPKEWERVRRLHVEGIKQLLDKPAIVAAWVGQRALFGTEHPYGFPIIGTAASAAALSLDDIKAFHRGVMRPSRAVVLTAGDLSAKEVGIHLERAFGAWQEPSEPAPALSQNLPKPENHARRVIIVDRPEAVQTVIRFVMPAGTYADPRRVPLELLNMILGGSFTSRLNQNLRERNGFTYGAASEYAMDPLAGYFFARSSVFADVTGAALAEFSTELESLRTGNISADESKKALTARRRDLAESLESLEGILATAERLVRNGWPMSDLGADLQAALRVANDDLNRLAKEAVPLEQGVLVLVGDKKKILEQVAELKLPPPVEWTVTGEEKK